MTEFDCPLFLEQTGFIIFSLKKCMRCNTWKVCDTVMWHLYYEFTFRRYNIWITPYYFQVCLFDHTLSPVQIQNLASRKVPAAGWGLTLYWPISKHDDNFDISEQIWHALFLCIQVKVYYSYIQMMLGIYNSYYWDRFIQAELIS